MSRGDIAYIGPSDQCTAEVPVFLVGEDKPLPSRWRRCENFVPDWDGDGAPLCDEHEQDANADA